MEPQKANLFALAFTPPAREVIELTDPALPGFRMTIELEASGPLTAAASSVIQREMVGRYCAGMPEIGMTAQPFIVGGKAVRTTPEFWEEVAIITALQPPDWSLPFEQFSPEELANLAFKSRHAWRHLGAKVRELHRRGEAALPNASGAQGED
jgi:hypothetical protein